MKIGYWISKINYFYHLLRFDKYRSFRKEIIHLKQDVKYKSKSFDYGEGFFYQSVPEINLMGLRDTKKRINQLNIFELLKEKSVLDIGSNMGSILIGLSPYFKKGIGIEYSEECVNIGNKIINKLGKKNINLILGDFNNYEFNEKFDFVFSLANHSTADGGIKDTKKYFQKAISLLNEGGIIVVESHAALYEKEVEFENHINENFNNKFKILSNGKYRFGNFYDLNRSYYIMKLINKKFND
tara:strand:+ start:985 stop:1707 length:723 start_codon:yes stop_codon:yes gene_type:complete